MHGDKGYTTRVVQSARRMQRKDDVARGCRERGCTSRIQGRVHAENDVERKEDAER